MLLTFIAISVSIHIVAIMLDFFEAFFRNNALIIIRMILNTSVSILRISFWEG